MIFFFLAHPLLFSHIWFRENFHDKRHISTGMQWKKQTLEFPERRDWERDRKSERNIQTEWVRQTMYSVDPSLYLSRDAKPLIIYHLNLCYSHIKAKCDNLEVTSLTKQNNFLQILKKNSDNTDWQYHLCFNYAILWVYVCLSKIDFFFYTLSLILKLRIVKWRPPKLIMIT